VAKITESSRLLLYKLTSFSDDNEFKKIHYFTFFVKNLGMFITGIGTKPLEQKKRTLNFGGIPCPK
jgi:hypothetical protein